MCIVFVKHIVTIFCFISVFNSFEVVVQLKERHEAHISGSDPGAV